MSDDNPAAFKHLFDKSLLMRMGDSLGAVHPGFDRKRFVGLLPQLQPLEMKARARLIRDELRGQLPTDYLQALSILLASAQGGTLSGFDLWPYSEFVQTYGLDHWQRSLEALRELTPRFSSEFAVRPFLIRYPEETLAFLRRAARDPSVDVRRWASEGSRPRLPWGERLHHFVRDPSPTLEILELLKFDDELYVRKSVSNHLNDIAKDHPEEVIKVLARWQREAGSEHAAKVDWIVHRALRTLIKNGHRGALRLIGVESAARLEVKGLRIERKPLRVGDTLEFAFTLRSLGRTPQQVVVDYIVHFVKASGGTSPKVFKLKKLELPAGAELAITKSHSLKPITTRVYYPGVHVLEVQVNGKVMARAPWALRA